MTTALAYRRAIEAEALVERTGRVTQFFGLVVEAEGPDVFVGERCEIRSGSGEVTFAEVVGLRAGRVLLMPYGELRAIRLGSEVVATGRTLDVGVGPALLGRVVDAFGRPLDDGPPLATSARYPLFADARNPLSRPRIDHVLETGVAAIDTLTAVGRGQRIGIFAGSGVGKSVLLGMIARHTAADVNVIALIGERGREVLDFVEGVVGEKGRARSVVLVATSDQPALIRARAALAATAIAEYFRDQGLHVVLAMDSITRVAVAQREIGLALGEPPTARGFTPSVFAMLPRILERGGPIEGAGTITAFYSVLVEGDDVNDPISDSIRAILDGHIVLSRDLANHGHYPAIDLLRSHSRLARNLCTPHERELAKEALEALSVYETHRDLVEIGAYRAGSNRDLDRSIRLMPPLRELLRQDLDRHHTRTDSLAALARILGDAGAAR